MGDQVVSTLPHSSQEHLRQLVTSIERLEEEKKALAADIRDKFAEAKGMGFDTKIMRKVIALRKKSSSDREEEDAVLAAYLVAMGMAGTPMGDWMATRDRVEEIGRAHGMSKDVIDVAQAGAAE